MIFLSLYQDLDFIFLNLIQDLILSLVMKPKLFTATSLFKQDSLKGVLHGD